MDNWVIGQLPYPTNVIVSFTLGQKYGEMCTQEIVFSLIHLMLILRRCSPTNSQSIRVELSLKCSQSRANLSRKHLMENKDREKTPVLREPPSAKA